MSSSIAAQSAEVRRELGGLALSCVPTDNAMLGVRAAHVRNALARVGLPAPFFVVHDFVMLALADPLQVPIAARSIAPNELALTPYAEMLRELASCEMFEQARTHQLGDELIAVLLMRVLGPVYERHVGVGRRPVSGQLPLDPELFQDLDAELPALYAAFDRESDVSFLTRVADEGLRLLIAIEQIDLDTLRLLGMFGAEASAAHALTTLDLFHALSSAEANDIANFSLDLLPSVLETRRASGAQRFAIDGYSGVDRRGTVDSLVLSELAFDDDLFEQRFVENEVFYYAREKQHEEDRQIHYICVDASASMRGRRSVFARGLALTLVKKFLLQKEAVYLRFFDSRLYDVMHERPGRRQSGGISVPYVLAFRSENGRNYPKVFNQLSSEVARLARRERCAIVVYLLTHAECHVPIETIERLRSAARLYGVFMLPSSGHLELDYVSRLHTVQIVDEAALDERASRAKRALDIVQDAAAEKPKKVAVDTRDAMDRDLDAMAAELLAKDAT